MKQLLQFNVWGFLIGCLVSCQAQPQVPALPPPAKLVRLPVERPRPPVATLASALVPRAIPKLPAAKLPVVARPRAAKRVAKKKPSYALRNYSQAQQAYYGNLTMEWLAARLYIRELTGRNDGPDVAALIRAGGGNPAERPEYCGYTQAADNLHFGLPVPIGPGGSYNWFLPRYGRNVLLGTSGSFDSVSRGDKLGLYSRSKKRIAHIMAADQVVHKNQQDRPQGVWSIAGNEGSGTKAGMHRTWYPKVNIYAAANWKH